MKFSEKILLALSRKPENNDYQQGQQGWDIDNAFSLLCKVFPNFKDIIVDKAIVDFGCGIGYQSIAMAKGRAKYVLGIDINNEGLSKARDLAQRLGIMQKVKFTNKLQDSIKGKFDIVISQNSMEHFNDPAKALNNMKSLLKLDGTILVTFGPPWFAPYGSHMQFFTKIPWVNILFSEKTILNVRAHFRNDGSTKYEEVKGGLNKITVKKFEQIILNSGLKIKYRRYDCVKGINLLGNLISRKNYTYAMPGSWMSKALRISRCALVNSVRI
ncbi:class I SAM-dependent methyltransferase [Desulfobacula sp.]|uniref:class I SAM-dependent methyltransferase n=1 Tax=Desulfobacula sp. TaxID=2593537 RepID=UPI002714FF59|nr:class I SAM-dependent methyltransferase [Desulfobacula sp.]